MVEPPRISNPCLQLLTSVILRIIKEYQTYEQKHH